MTTPIMLRARETGRITATVLFGRTPTAIKTSPATATTTTTRARNTITLATNIMTHNNARQNAFLPRSQFFHTSSCAGKKNEIIMNEAIVTTSPGVGGGGGGVRRRKKGGRPAEGTSSSSSEQPPPGTSATTSSSSAESSSTSSSSAGRATLTTTTTDRVRVTDRKQFRNEAEQLLLVFYEALKPLQSKNDFFLLKHVPSTGSDNGTFEDDTTTTKGSGGTVAAGSAGSGPSLTLDLGPMVGQHIIQVNLNECYITYSSPVTGLFAYGLIQEDGVTLNTWRCLADGHELSGMLVRDILKTAQGCPNL